jgi:hypothetical protein
MRILSRLDLRFDRSAVCWRTVLAVCLGSCLSTSCTSKSAPEFFIESRSQDFGLVSPDGTLVELSIQNKGNRELSIQDVTRMGACKVIEWPKQLAPGASGVIKVELGRAYGQNSASVLISSNDPQDLHQVFLSWYCKTAPTFNPRMLSFHGIQPGQVVSSKATLDYSGSNKERVPVIESISTSSPAVIAELVSTNHQAEFFPIHRDDTHAVLGQQEIKVVWTAPAVPGQHRESCRLLISWPGGAEEFTIPIEAWVVGNLRCPGALVFSGKDLAGNDPVRRSTKVFVAKRIKGEPQVIAPEFLRCTLVRLSDQQREKEVCYEMQAELQRSQLRIPSTATVIVEIPGERKEIPVIVQISAER